ncbi:MAG: sulfite exporter TauE/SafE family protein, partial [Caulobacteraceae bacterium]
APAPLRPGRWAGVDGAYPGADRVGLVDYQVDRLPLGMGLMFGAGLLSALLGIGSGVLKIPAMDSALRLPIKVSSATSNFMIGVTAAASAVAYFLRGDIKPAIAGPIVLGSVLGAVAGAKLVLVLPGERLRLLFVAALVLLSLQMLAAALGAGMTMAPA